MKERPTARVLLIDPDGRILMMKGRLPNDPGGASFWFPIGGGVEAGESVREAAQREILEESGLTDAILGDVVWYREVIIEDEGGAPWLFKEHYLVARTRGGALSRALWAEHEHALVDELRWWTLPELAATQETVFPQGIAKLLPEVLAGIARGAPLVLPAADGRVRR